MNDKVKDMISKALLDEPPVGVDYDSVVASGRRRRARRQAGIVGGAVLGVAAVVSSAVLVGRLSSANPSLIPAGPTTSSTAQPAPAGGCAMPKFTGGFTDNPSGEASAEELAESARLTEAFGRFAFKLPSGVTMDPAKPRLCAIKHSWGTQFTLHSPNGARTVFLEVQPRGAQPAGDCAGKVNCGVDRLPDGSSVRITETPQESKQPAMINVIAWRSDDTLVRVMETGAEADKPSPRILDDRTLTNIATAAQLKVALSAPPRPAEASDRRAGELTSSMTKVRVLPDGMRAEKVPQARADAMAFYLSQGGYKLNADLVDAAGSGNLFIDLSAPVAGVLRGCGGASTCELIILPDGRNAIVTRQSTGSVQRISLSTLATDGTQVSIMTSNISAKAESQGKTEASRAAPSLSVDDLIRIAALPWLRW